MTWRVEGMFCPHCEQTILGALSGLPGLFNVRVSYRASTLSADWDRALLSGKTARGHTGQSRLYAQSPAFAPSGCARLCGRRCRADSAVFRCGSLPARHMDRRFPDRQGGHESRRAISRRLDDLAPLRRHVPAASTSPAQETPAAAPFSIIWGASFPTRSSAQSSARWAVRSACPPPCQAGIQLFAAAFMLAMALNLLGCFRFLPSLRLPGRLSGLFRSPFILRHRSG